MYVLRGCKKRESEGRKKERKKEGNERKERQERIKDSN